MTTLSSFGQRQFRMSSNINKAYNNIISFKLKEGRTDLYNEVKKDPTNAMVFVMQNYEDFVSLCFNENPSLYKSTRSQKDKRLALISKSNKQSPYYLLSKGIIHLQWSLIHVKYKEFFKAALDFKKAFGYFKENKKRFPAFKETNIFFGAQQAIIGTIPDNYKWISNTLGLKGNIKNGMALLKASIVKENKPFQADAKFYYIYLTDILLNNSKKSLSLISTYNLDTKNNYLFTFMKSNLELNNFKAQQAINTINGRNKSAAYMQPNIFDYEKGIGYLYTSQYSKSTQSLKRFLNSKTYFYKKDACIKIAYAYYLQGSNNQAILYKNKVKAIGTSVTDIDKQALKFSQRTNFGNKEILRARLLFDGGQFRQAENILLHKSKLAITNKQDELERIYRLARCYDEQHNMDKAIEHYKLSISMPNPTKAYFPARAALQLAYIYETKGQPNLANKYFKKVISYKDHEFKTSLDHRAKAGLLRIKGL